MAINLSYPLLSGSRTGLALLISACASALASGQGSADLTVNDQLTHLTIEREEDGGPSLTTSLPELTSPPPGISLEEYGQRMWRAYTKAIYGSDVDFNALPLSWQTMPESSREVQRNTARHFLAELETPFEELEE
jgi:hypothetical protein